MRSFWTFTVLCVLSAPGRADADAARPDLLYDLVVPRTEWAARAHGCVAEESGKELATIHHTAESAGGDDFVTMLQGIQRFHIDDNGWCDLGYHFVVTMDGRVWEGRPIEYRGAHVAGANASNIGVSYAGCFDDDPYCDGKLPREPTEAAILAGALLVERLADEYGFAIRPDTVLGHRDHGSSTVCPGEYLHARLDSFRATAQDGLGCEALPSAGGVIDDGSLCFERRGEPGLWAWSSAGQEDSVSEFSPLLSEDPMHVGAWTVEVQAEGWYQIDTHLEGADPSPSLYRVQSADGDDEMAVEAEAGWLELGVFFFESGASYQVSKGVEPDEAGAKLGFDSIRLTAADDPGTGAGCGCSADTRSDGGRSWSVIVLALGCLLFRRRRAAASA